MIRNRFLVILIMVFFITGGCTSYKRQPVAFKMPSAYSNATQVAGATVASKAFDDTKEAKEAFGFDIRGSGLYPVQVIFDNTGKQSLQIDPTQTFLVDGEGNLWSVIDSSLAYDRITEKTELSRIGKSGVKTGFLTAAAGGLLGGAIGIVTGRDVLSSAGKGAALGGAVGATAGGAKAATSGSEARAEVVQDLRGKSLENKAVAPGTIAHGFVFFPGEATGKQELRLQLREVETGNIHTLRLQL